MKEPKYDQNRTGIVRMLAPHGTISIRAYTTGEMIVIYSEEDHEGTRILHMSVSHPTRYPSWEELKELADFFFPTETEVYQLVKPGPEKTWTNIHPNCFHLWARVDGKTLGTL